MAAGTYYFSFKYVQENDRVQGIVFVGQDSCSGKVDGIKCNLCVSFGLKFKVGSKRKLKANVISWKSLFCYENIEKHLIGQQPVKCKDYSSLSNGAKDTFFEGYVSFRKKLQYKFTGISRGEHDIVFDLKKEIVEVLIVEILFEHFGKEDHNNGN